MIQPCACLDEQAVPIDTIIHGDALAVLKTFPDCCIDAIVCDPPAGIFFMGRNFDSDRGGRDLWIVWLRDIMAEAMRTLKPGGHAFVWALPRTSHWTATALEDAGFEIRDVVSHAFGVGMPKSLDISRAIDKEAGKEREVIGAKSVQGGYHHKAIINDDGWEGSPQYITAPATPESQRHVGVGTGIKPAHENWILCRKPISERTIAANVLRWGVGGLNIDKCRIDIDEKLRPYTVGAHQGKGHSVNPYFTRTNQQERADAGLNARYNPQGRWPANFLLSHTLFCTEAGCDETCAVRLLDEQSGIRKSGGRVMRAGQEMPLRFKNVYGKGSAVNHEAYKLHPSEGTAARFFQTFSPDPFIYQSKPSRRERNAGCEKLPIPVLDSSEIVMVQSSHYCKTSIGDDSQWENEAQQVRLRVDTAQSRPKVTDVYGTSPNSVSEWNMLLFGNDLTESSLKECKFTMSTMTNLITESKTLNWLIRSLTNDSIADVNLETVNGGNHAENAETSTGSVTITSEKAVYLPGVGLVASQTPLTITASAIPVSVDFGTMKAGGSGKPVNGTGLPLPRTNGHPCVKSIALMSYLIRMITPDGGIVLDCFAGSGSTLVAAIREGVHFIGIEEDADYVTIARARIAHEVNEKGYLP